MALLISCSYALRLSLYTEGRNKAAQIKSGGGNNGQRRGIRKTAAIVRSRRIGLERIGGASGRICSIIKCCPPHGSRAIEGIEDAIAIINERRTVAIRILVKEFPFRVRM
jgi:hypothetical protein